MAADSHIECFTFDIVALEFNVIPHFRIIWVHVGMVMFTF